MFDRWSLCCCALAVVLTARAATADENLGLRVPEGFEVTLYAGDELAHDIFSMTIDAQERVVVAGRGYVKRLEDTDGDGHADRAVLFSPVPKSGAHGMYFDGPDLICTGDDSLMRLRDTDGDGVADSRPEIWARLRHPEHGANGVLRGPDGWYYVICGNDAGVSKAQAALPTSPVKDPRCGAVVRFSSDGKRSEVVAHGFRNPYDADFTAAGNLFTVDADGERDHYLPWYAPTRLFDVAQGMEHGWLLHGWQRSWNRPESYFDNVERAVEIGRGSPTGLTVYRHRQFPRKYRGRVFTACWTLGRVYAIALEASGASYKGNIEVFLQTTGDVGFAPVDLAVGPDGDLFVAVGGRGTRGSVFRIRYAGPAAINHQRADDLTKVLEADQPLASWSRARWVLLAKKLGPAAFVPVLDDTSQSIERQVRAVEVITEVFGGISNDVARKAIALGKPELSARIAWSLSRRGPDAVGQSILAELTYDQSPRVQRAAWEALGALAAFDSTMGSDPPNWRGAAESPIRHVRAAMIAAARGPCRAGYGRFNSYLPPGAIDTSRGALTELWVHGPPANSDVAALRRYVSICGASLRNDRRPDVRLEAVRLLQLALGDVRVQPGQPEVYSGYSGNATDAVDASLRNEIVQSVAKQFPAVDAELDREMARLLAMLSADHDGLLDKIATRFTPTSPVLDDIHYLIVLSRLGGKRSPEASAATAQALCGLHRKMAAGKMYPDVNWPLRVGEVFGELCKRDPALPLAVSRDESFGLPAHSLFAAAMTGEAQKQAAARLLAAVDKQGRDADDSTRWTPELVRVVAVLPEEEIVPRLHGLWDEPTLRDAIALVLARHPQPEDRTRFIEALPLTQAGVTACSAEALAALGAQAEGAEISAAVVALRRSCAVPEQRDARAALVRLLTNWSGKRFDVEERKGLDLLAAYRPWFAWFESAYPTEAARLKVQGGADVKAWAARLAKIDWPTGEAKRGKKVFEAVTCHRCHTGGARLGPELTGAAGRFARDDLFVAIVDPSRDVSPTYQTTAITTRTGKAYTGALVYDSSDGLLLQTGPDTTVRITGDDVANVQPSRQSLMPSGLLDKASDQDLADLYAYLKTLSAK